MSHKINKVLNVISKRYSTRSVKLSHEDISLKRISLFNDEEHKQHSLISRVNKIKVKHIGIPEPCSLLMNKDISTPLNVAMHLNESLVKRSVVAVVNGQPWHMHRPLVEDCDIKFVHFMDDQPEFANQAFWRSCSFILGYVMERAFKNENQVQLCSFPSPNVKSGSFMYDAKFCFDWTPSEEELRLLSRVAARTQFLDQSRARIRSLNVDASVALKMFQDNPLKCNQIEDIASRPGSKNSVNLYSMDDHVDMSSGPMMSSSNLIGRFNISAIHDIDTKEYGSLKRIQGVAIPKQLSIHYFAYEMLEKRAKIFNATEYPSLTLVKPV